MQVRNGFAELIKISSVGKLDLWKGSCNVFELHLYVTPKCTDLVKYGPQLVKTRFGRLNDDQELIQAADSICERAIKLMLELESPNLHEIRLNRVIAFGHTYVPSIEARSMIDFENSWSPTLELTPVIPLRHGHAITIDMAYGTTLAWKRGYITEEERDEFHQLAYDVGLSLDHEAFDAKLLDVATTAILKTRDGKQWFAEPRPLGTCFFINDASMEELKAALVEHKSLIKTKYAKHANGVGHDAFVDKSDLGMDPEERMLLSSFVQHPS